MEFPIHRPLRSIQEVNALKLQEVDLAKRLLQDFPGSEDALVIMANVWHRQGNAEQALDYWQQALQKNPRRADIYASMGWLAVKQGKFEQAVALYRQGLSLQANLPDAYSNLAHALMMLGRQEEAIAALQRDLQLSPNAAASYFMLAQAQLQLQAFDQAKENYAGAIRVDPNHANAHYGLATVWSRLGKRDQAAKHMVRFKTLKAEQRKDVTGRRVVHDDLVETQQNAAFTYVEVGRMYRDAGRLVVAEDLLKRAAGFDPEFLACYLELANLYRDRRQPARALQMFRKISDIKPNHPTCHINIGLLATELGRFKEGEKALQRAITLTPKQSIAYRELAGLYLKQGRNYGRAWQLAKKAVALEPSAPNYFVLSWTCLRSGDTEKALSAVNRAMKLDPSNLEYRRLLQLIQSAD